MDSVDPVTQKQLYDELGGVRAERDHAIEQVEAFASKVVGDTAAEVKKEVRWLVVLSVGLNQFLGAIDLTQLSGAAGATLLGAWGVKAAVTWFAR